MIWSGFHGHFIKTPAWPAILFEVFRADIVERRIQSLLVVEHLDVVNCIPFGLLSALIMAQAHAVGFEARE